MLENKQPDKELIPQPERKITAFSKALSIAEKALLPSRKAEAFQFCRRHPTFFFQLISKHYSFTPDLIHELFGKLDFKLLSSNKNVKWTSQLISAYSGKWSWWILNLNDSLPWNIDFIRQFQGVLDWKGISEKADLHWTTDFIDEFWSFFSSEDTSRRFISTEADGKKSTKIALSRNSHLPWSISFIDRYIDYWDWKMLSRNPGLPWGPELIDRYKEKWKWWELSSNIGIPWSLGLIDRYIEKLRFGGEDEEGWKSLCLSGNISLPWSYEFIEHFKTKWDWSELSGNKGLPWSDELIRTYTDKWDWSNLARNSKILWTYDIIKENENRFAFDSHFWQNNVEWTEKLLDEYASKWNWDNLSGNENLPWSEHLIKKYEKLWNWGGPEKPVMSFRGLSGNPKLPWSLEFINKYVDHIKWNWFSANRGVNWTVKLIELYWNKLEEQELINNGSVWEKAFKPCVDDQFIRNFSTECSNIPAVIVCNPENFVEIRQIARDSFKKRDYETCIVHCNAILKENPDNEDVRTNRAIAFFSNRQYSEAIHDYTWLINKHHKQAGKEFLFFGQFLGRSRSFYQAGDLSMALKDADVAVKLDSKYEGVFINRANIYAKMRQYQKAIDDYSHALDLSPNDSLALEHRAEAYEKLGKDRLAYSDISSAIQNSSAGYSRYGLFKKRIAIDKKLKDFKCAVSDLTILINSEPDVKESWYLYQERANLLCELQRWEEAIQDYHLLMGAEQDEELFEEFPDLVRKCAEAYQKIGNLLAAEEEYRKLIMEDGKINGIKTESDLINYLSEVVGYRANDDCLEKKIMQRLIEKLNGRSSITPTVSILFGGPLQIGEVIREYFKIAFSEYSLTFDFANTDDSGVVTIEEITNAFNKSNFDLCIIQMNNVLALNQDGHPLDFDSKMELVCTFIKDLTENNKTKVIGLYGPEDDYWPKRAISAGAQLIYKTPIQLKHFENVLPLVMGWDTSRDFERIIH